MRRSALLLAVGVYAVAMSGCAAVGVAAASAAVSRVAAGPDREVIGPRTDVPLSEAVRVRDTYYFSGKIGATAATRELTQGRAAAETRNILEAFRQALARHGLGFADVVSVNVYLDDMRDYEEMNRVYAGYFPSNAPARVTVGVEALPAGAAVEISIVVVAR